MPVRLLKNKFSATVFEAEELGAAEQELLQLLGSGRAKKGMFEGQLDEGELEIGQVSALITEIKPAVQIVEETWREFQEACINPFRKV